MATFPIVYFRGRPTCMCMKKWLPVYERELIDRKLLKVEVDIYQLHGFATASANTHKGGGVADLAQFTPQQLAVARQMGGVSSYRGAPAFSTPHAHLVLKGCPHLDPSAAAQVKEIEEGGDGLVGTAKDAGPRHPIPIPFRTWEAGIAWALANQKRRALTVKIKAQRVTVRRARRKLERLIDRRAAL